MAYTHTNSRGEQFVLHGKQITLQNNRQQQIYFFARTERPDESLDAVPAGYAVAENGRTGLPILKKS